MKFEKIIRTEFLRLICLTKRLLPLIKLINININFSGFQSRAKIHGGDH